MTDENSPAQRSRLTRWSLVVVAVFVVATGAFGALWFIERGNHKTTADHLGTARAEVQDAKTKLANMAKRHIDVQNRVKKAEQEIQKHEADAAANKPCTDAGHELVTAEEDAAIRAAVRQLEARCK
ncbi:hypothetical protein DMH04_40075 [Kibdelosporangium aridum]|uniref:Uncharacterized protein n=1 Tax=Kibdelosporangium aridum TaxID=2030 RepID=A0A428YWN0_KIBAR|nr:hypothetical protein [Kibdelosporangium aridum]RSM74343.1 hypothetical protein DMH04_40075 [Kibdelosporangium aridum]